MENNTDLINGYIDKKPMEDPKDLVFFDKTFDDFQTLTIEDPRKFSKIKLKKKRSKKKFKKYWYRYVSSEIYAKYMARMFVAPLLRPLNYAEIGRKLLKVDPLPEGAFAYINNQNKTIG